MEENKEYGKAILKGISVNKHIWRVIEMLISNPGQRGA